MRFYEDEIKEYLKKRHPNDDVIQSITNTEIRKIIRRYWKNVFFYVRKGYAVRLCKFSTLVNFYKIDVSKIKKKT